jgi:hypothetical protein
MNKAQNRNIGRKRRQGNMMPQKTNNNKRIWWKVKGRNPPVADIRRLIIRMFNELKKDLKEIIQKQLNEFKRTQTKNSRRHRNN